MGVIDQPNIPGTVNEHPNWRQRLPVAIDEIAVGDRCCRAQGRDRRDGRARRPDASDIQR